MKAGDVVFRSILDKPLEELTEEDISQLTREDCRRYLKEKGMRRPSWNKSQAIQQVLSLKTLFESKPVSGDSGQKPANPSQINSLKEASITGREQKQADPPDLEKPIPANEFIFLQKKHSVTGDHLNFPANVEFRPPETGKKTIFRDDRSCSPSTGAGNEPVSQLTIFYSGIVNVYDDVPADKAQMIMLLAASPSYLPHIPLDEAQPNQKLPASFPTGWVRSSSVSPPATVVASNLQNEVPKTRKESVQRFLEKRKDRLKGNHAQNRDSPCLEDYWNGQFRGSRSDKTLNPQSSASSTCSPNGPMPPHTPSRCSSIESHAIFSLFNCLNGDDLQDG